MAGPFSTELCGGGGDAKIGSYGNRPLNGIGTGGRVADSRTTHVCGGTECEYCTGSGTAAGPVVPNFLLNNNHTLAPTKTSCCGNKDELDADRSALVVVISSSKYCSTSVLSSGPNCSFQ